MTEWVYELLYLFPYSLTAELLGLGIVEDVEWNVWCVLIAVACSLCADGMIHFGKKGRFVLTGSLIISVLAVKWGSGEELVGQWLVERAGYGYVILLAVVGIGVAIPAIRLIRVRLALCGISFAYLLYGMFAGIEVNRWLVTMMLFPVLLTLVELVQRRWEKSGTVETQKHIVYLMPFLLMSAIVFQALPDSPNPYQWTMAKKICNRVADGAKVILQKLPFGGTINYDMAMVGFSEDADLKGKLSDKPKEIMQIDSGWDYQTVLYLSGKVFDSFDGRSWAATDLETDRDRTMDALEWLTGISNNVSSHPEDFYRLMNMTITYRSMTSMYLFAPLKTIPDGTMESLQVLQKGSNLVLPTQKGYLFSYDLKYCKLNQGQDIFHDILPAKAYPGVDEIEDVYWDQWSRNRRGKEYDFYDADLIGPADVKAYREKIGRMYLGDRADLTERTLDLLQTIVADAATDYEKLLRIEAYLQKMEYRASPGPLSERVQSAGTFLDEFLFEKRGGYCVYYATAFVLMARECGVPARYVQGYCVPVKKRGTVTVMSDMAHAWPEVYFEDFGWLPFDPTPGYQTRNSWKTYAEKQAEYNDLPNGPFEWEDAEEENTEDMAVLPEETKEQTIVWYIPASACGGILLLLCAVILVDGRMNRRKYDSLDVADRTQVLCLRCLCMLELLGQKRNQNETLAEFKVRMQMPLACQTASEQNETGTAADALEFIPVYESMIYGKWAGAAGPEKTGSIPPAVQQSYELLLQQLRRKKRLGFWFLYHFKIENLFRFRDR